MISCCAKNRTWALTLALFWFASATFLVAQNPTCSISLSPNPVALGRAGRCAGNVSLPSQTIDWGDGASDSISPSPFNNTHTYTATGTFTAATDILLKVGAASQQVRMPPPELVSIAVTPPNPSIPLGITKQFTATGTYSNGRQRDLTNVANWASTNTGVATVNSQGLATSVAVGGTNVTASVTTPSETTIVGSTTLTVTPPQLVSIAVTPANPSVHAGLPQQFTATGTYTDKSTKPITTLVLWSSSNLAVATISNAAGTQGLATSLSQGTATITATSGSDPLVPPGTATLTVTAPVLASIAISPPNPSIPLGMTKQFTATGTYTDGTTKDLTASATWSSDAPSVASIGASGLATAVSIGVAHITATYGNVSQSTTVTITPPLPPTCSPQASLSSGKAPLLVSVTANCSVLGDQIVTTILDFGDGFYQSGASAAHTYVGGARSPSL